MKWREFYSEGLYLCDTEVQDVMGLMARGEGYPVKFVTPDMVNSKGDLIDEKFAEEPMFYLVIRSIAVDRKADELHMVVKTRGELPAGVRHGTYEIVFNSLGISKDLPEDMFSDEEVPHDLLPKRGE